MQQHGDARRRVCRTRDEPPTAGVCDETSAKLVFRIFVSEQRTRNQPRWRDVTRALGISTFLNFIIDETSAAESRDQ